MIIYQIKLPKKHDADAFAKFMHDEYFPAVLKVASTRLGRATELTLLQREKEIEGETVDHEFFCHVGWAGQPTGQADPDDEVVARKFQSFGASMERLGFYSKVTAQRADGKSI